METRSMLRELGLPDQFGLVLLLLSLVLLLAPYLAGSDLGVLKIPQFSEGAKRALRVIGPVALALAVLLHAPMLRDEAQTPADSTTPAASTTLAASTTPPTADAAQCSVAGTVFDEASRAPLPGVRVDVFRDVPDARPSELRRSVATTGLRGEFSFDCSWIEAAQYPIVLGLAHSDWVATRITGQRIDGPGRWRAINLAVKLRERDLVPLREIVVSFSHRRTPDGALIVGHVENESERGLPCVRVTFQLWRRSAQGRSDAGTLDVEVRDLRPRERRPFEQAVPNDVGYGVRSKEECA